MPSPYDATAIRALDVIRRKGAPVAFLSLSGQPLGTGRAVSIDTDARKWQALGYSLTRPVTLLVAAKGLALTPTVGMLFDWASARYAIRAAELLAPDGTPILWTLVGDV